MNKVSKEFIEMLEGIANGEIWHSNTLKGAKWSGDCKGIAFNPKTNIHSWENLVLVVYTRDWANNPYWRKPYPITRKNMMATDWVKIEKQED